MKRKARAFKIADEPYFKAMELAKKEGKYLANLIEDFVTDYAKGNDRINLFVKNKVLVQDLTKEKAVGRVYEEKEPDWGRKNYSENARFKIVNGKKVFK